MLIQWNLSLANYIAIIIIFILNVFILFFKERNFKIRYQKKFSIFFILLENVRTPFFLLSIALILDLTSKMYITTSSYFEIFYGVVKSLEILSVIWIIASITNSTNMLILNMTKSNLIKIMLPLINNSLKYVFVLISLKFIVINLNLAEIYKESAENIIEIFIIIVIARICFHISEAIETIINYQYKLINKNNFNYKKVKTQISILKKIFLSLIIIATISLILLHFENVRKIGAGLLTTAGVISAIVAFASQQSISRLFSGLQIAFTQPLRIGDIVVIDSEIGEIEEISLNFVVIKIWNLRRLILPTDYLLTKGFQNLTRNSTQLLGTVFIYTDYNLPIQIIRRKFLEFISISKYWDHCFAAMHVTNAKESTLEIRALMSAENSDKLFELSCEMREKLIQFINETFPESLPKIRTQLYSSNLIK